MYTKNKQRRNPPRTARVEAENSNGFWCFSPRAQNKNFPLQNLFVPQKELVHEVSTLNGAKLKFLITVFSFNLLSLQQAKANDEN